MRRALPALLLAALTSRALADGDEFQSAERGFRIGRPDAGWAMLEQPPPEGAEYAMKVARGDGRTETSVTVYLLARQGIAGAKAARDAAAKRHRADPKAGEVRTGAAPLAGGEAPWVEFAYEAGGTTYTLRQHYLVRDEEIVIVQSAAPAAAFEKHAKSFDAILASFAFTERASPESRERDALLRRLAERCGSELAWAEGWEEAAARAAKEQKLVLVVVEEYRGIVGDRYAPSTLLMDGDVVALVNERFVPMVWTGKTPAPFTDPAVYGLGPSTFGQGTLFVAADGQVVAAGVSFDPFYFDEFARGVLRAHPGAPAADAQDPAARLRRGDLEAAAELLAAPESARDWLLRASLLRRLRKGREALEAVARARELGAAQEADLAEAVIRLRLGEPAAAERLLDAREDPEARFWLALARGLQRGLEPVHAELEALAAGHPDDRWGWRAAALRVGKGFATGIERAAWPEEARLAACAGPEYAAAAKPEAAAGDAVRFLLETQLADGSWPSPLSLGDPRGPGAVAVTSICGSALLARREREGAGAAADRALDFVLACELRADPARLFDYTIWGQIFSLRFLAEAAQAKVRDRGRLVAAMNALVRALKRDRRSGGGWAYFRMEGRTDASIGFVTAAALLALRDARAAGADVPDDLLETAGKTLLPMRAPSGAFTYMLETRADPGAREAEASLRSPLYALALRRGGELEAAGVRDALEVYRRHHETTRVERGKGLCHTGPEGTASYYLLYGYAFAAEALAEIAEPDRAPYRAALEDDLARLRAADGSFCDNPMMGRHVGAGLALRALRALGR